MDNSLYSRKCLDKIRQPANPNSLRISTGFSETANLDWMLHKTPGTISIVSIIFLDLNKILKHLWMQCLPGQTSRGGSSFSQKFQTRNCLFGLKHRRNYLRNWLFFAKLFLPHREPNKTPGTIAIVCIIFLDANRTLKHLWMQCLPGQS